MILWMYRLSLSYGILRVKKTTTGLGLYHIQTRTWYSCVFPLIHQVCVDKNFGIDLQSSCLNLIFCLRLSFMFYCLFRFTRKHTRKMDARSQALLSKCTHHPRRKQKGILDSNLIGWIVSIWLNRIGSIDFS